MYVGQQPVVGRYILLDQISGGFNGTASGFTMTAGGQGVIPGLAQNVLLSLGGVIQQPGADYLVSGSGLTFTTPPVSGTTFFATVLGDAQAVGTPSDGTVIPASIASSGTFVFPNVTVTGVTTIASGTAAAPSLSISGDANTGLYSPGADQLAIATSGTGRLFVDASGRLTITAAANPGISSNGSIQLTGPGSAQLQTSDASGLYLDSTAAQLWLQSNSDIIFRGSASAYTERMRLDTSGRLGIGTSSPAVPLDVIGTIRSSTTVAASSDFRIDNQTYSRVAHSNGVGGFVGGYNVKWSTGVKHDSTGNLSAIYYDNGGVLRFYTNSTQAADSTPAERLTITSAGNVGIGATSPSVKCQITESAAATECGLRVTNANNAQGIEIAAEASGANTHIWNYGNGYIRFATNNTEIARIDSSGRLGLGTSSPQSALDIANGPFQSVRTYLSSITDTYHQYRGTPDGSGYEHARVFSGRDTSVHTYGSYLAFYTEGKASGTTDTSVERLRIDSSGRLLVGTSTSRSVAGVQWNQQIEGTSFTGASFVANTNNSNQCSFLVLGKSGGTSVGSNTIVSSGDTLGEIIFSGADGTDLDSNAALIRAQVDGTPGANDMPGRLVFSTTADGASSPTERCRLNSNGLLFTYGAFDSIVAGSAQGAGTTYTFYQGIHSRTGTTTGGTESFRVYTNGNVQNTNNSYTAISDAKLKENIVDASSQWDDLKALRVRNYNLKEGQTHKQIGLVAQEVEPISPGLVYESPDRDAEGNDLGTVTKSVNYSVLYMKAVKALQEAMERIEQLEFEMAAVKSQLS